MWKVKRMNTARIVVLTPAVGAGGVVAYPANGSDNKPLPTEQLAQPQTGERINVVRYGVSSTTMTQK
jgi:pilus assembly protein CpaB